MIDNVIQKLQSFKYNGSNLEELESLIGIRTAKGINLAGTDILKSALQNRFSDDPRLEQTMTLINQRVKEYNSLISVKDAGDILKKILVPKKDKRPVGLTASLTPDEDRVFSYYSDKESKVAVCQKLDWVVNEAPNSVLSYFTKLMDNQKQQKNKVYSQIIALLYGEMKIVKQNDIVIMPKALSRIVDKCGEIELASPYKCLQPFVTENNKIVSTDFVCGVLDNEYKVYKKQFKMNNKTFNVFYVLKKKNLKESVDRTKEKANLRVVK